eukprot:scaffold1390_cov234-Prasinococcus_capsulatus_cf.AAC.2
MSIDGSHTAAATRSDLALASAVLVRASGGGGGAAARVPLGVVAVDDAFNADWPGVATGLATFLLADDSNTRCACAFCTARRGAGSGRPSAAAADDCTALAPFLLAFNKCFLCRPAAHQLYLAAMLAGPGDDEARGGQSGAAGCRKRASFMGWEPSTATTAPPACRSAPPPPPRVVASRVKQGASRAGRRLEALPTGKSRAASSARRHPLWCRGACDAGAGRSKADSRHERSSGGASTLMQGATCATQDAASSATCGHAITPNDNKPIR